MRNISVIIGIVDLAVGYDGFRIKSGAQITFL